MRNEPLNYFSESQRFRQLWLWIIILAVDGVVIYAVLSEMQHQAIDSSTALLAACGVTVFTVGFLLAFRLDTRISADGIRYRFLPFQWKFKHLGWEEISKA